MTYIRMSAEELILAADALDIIKGSRMAEDLSLRLRVRHAELDDEATQKRWDAYRKAVVTVDGECECDDNALVSEGDGPGAYVMTWTWVTNGEADLCEECSGSLDDGEGDNGLCGDCADKAEAMKEDAT